MEFEPSLNALSMELFDRIAESLWQLFLAEMPTLDMSAQDYNDLLRLNPHLEVKINQLMDSLNYTPTYFQGCWAWVIAKGPWPMEKGWPAGIDTPMQAWDFWHNTRGWPSDMDHLAEARSLKAVLDRRNAA